MSDAFEPVGPEGQLAPGNIDLHKRPVVQNPDGTISTVRSITKKTDDGVALIPTVHPDGYVMSDQDAIKHFQDTGEHLGMFDNYDNAEAYARSLHQQQDKEYSPRGEGLNPNGGF